MQRLRTCWGKQMTKEGNLNSLENKLGYKFKDDSLLLKALTHSSVNNIDNNQYLEYLGDSLLDFLVAEYLYRKYPNMREGEATQIRARIVSRWPLANLFDNFNLVDLIFIHNVNVKTLSIKLKSDFVESIIGAMFLDGGIDVARDFVWRFLCSDTSVVANPDYKSQLYEYSAKNNVQIVYETRSEGIQHKQRFYSKVYLDGVEFGSGEGNNKREAEQGASKKALEKLL